MTCPQLVDSGVYVLGALPPSQRMAFEAHMAQCDECRNEVNELAVLPGLLGRIDASAFDLDADAMGAGNSGAGNSSAGDLGSGNRGYDTQYAAGTAYSSDPDVNGTIPASNPRNADNRGAEQRGAGQRPGPRGPGAGGPTPSRPHSGNALPAAIDKINRRRRRRRLGGLAGALAVAVLALFAGFALPHRSSAPPAPVVAAPLTWHQMKSMSGTPITAKVALTPTGAGTTVAVKCKYPTIGASPEYGTDAKSFALFVYPRNGGQPQQIGTWTASPGDQLTIPAVTAWALPNVSEVELRSADGTPLLTYDVT